MKHKIFLKYSILFILLLSTQFLDMAAATPTPTPDPAMPWIATKDVKTTLNQTVTKDDSMITTVWENMMDRHLQGPYLTENNELWSDEIKLNGGEMAYYFQDSVSMDEPGLDFLALHYIEHGDEREDYAQISYSDTSLAIAYRPEEHIYPFEYSVNYTYTLDESQWNQIIHPENSFSISKSFDFKETAQIEITHRYPLSFKTEPFNGPNITIPSIRKLPFLELFKKDIHLSTHGYTRYNNVVYYENYAPTDTLIIEGRDERIYIEGQEPTPNPTATPLPYEPETRSATEDDLNGFIANFYLYNERFGWSKENQSIYAYPARSSNPVLWNPYGGTYLEKFDQSLIVNTEHRVKKMAAVFYKKNNDGNYTVAAEFTQSVEDTNIQDMRAFYITPEDVITEDGEYMMVLGMVDLFNKIYFFEPETFILDSQPPVIKGITGIPVVNPDTTITSAFHYILKWADIYDNVTTYEDETDFIYVTYGNEPGTMPVNIKDLKDQNGISLFTIGAKEVRLNNEANAAFGPFTFYLQDETRMPVSINPALKGITYIYNTAPPVVTLDSNQNVYKNGDSVSLKVDALNPNLQIKQLGIQFEDGTYSVADIDLSPVKLNKKVYQSEIENKLTILEQALFESIYILSGDYYILNSGFWNNQSQEQNLRQLLTKIGYIPYKDITNLEIPLSQLKGKKGDFSILTKLTDDGGLINEIDSFGPFSFNDLDEDMIISIGNIAVPVEGHGEYNNNVDLKVEKNDDNILSFDVNINSTTLPGSGNTYTASAILDAAVIPLVKDGSVTQPKEEVQITVTAYYVTGKTTIFTRFVDLYADNTGPVISQELVFGNENAKIVVKDESNIDFITVKYLDNLQTTPDFNSFTPEPADVNSLNGWNLLSGSTPAYTGHTTLLPGSAACVYAVDKWGNTNSFIFQKTESPAMQVINTPQDLVFDGSGVTTLNGDILITCDLTIENGQTLNLGGGAVPTRVYFDSSIQGSPIKIVNYGKIVLNTQSETLTFSGLNTIEDAYKWFGIQNKTGGILEQAGPSAAVFNNAVAALSFENPAPAGNMPIVLSNIKAADCLMGIHFIDDADYTPLELRDCDFTGLVYGIKFEITPDSLPVMGNLEDYFTLDEFSSFTDIKRTEVYWKSMDVDALTTGL